MGIVNNIQSVSIFLKMLVRVEVFSNAYILGSE